MQKKAPERRISQDRIAPLDEIRQEEAKIARLRLLALEQAAALEQEARQQAEQAKEQARSDGLRDGEAARAQMTALAQQEAQQVVAQARVKADHLRAQTEPLVASAAAWAERVVLGLEKGGPTP